MPTAHLPEQPNIEQLRTQARELQRRVRAGEPKAVRSVARRLPDAVPGPDFPLTAAQTVLARRYGFTSWSRLRRHVEIINERTWVLSEPSSGEAPADRFLRLACLNYTQDRPGDRTAAAAWLAEHPDLPSTSVAVAAVCGEAGEVARLLSGDPAAATRPSGPYGWSPLLYQTYGRLVPDAGESASLQTMTSLLSAGADPNDGRFFLGLPTPFTALTGVFANDSRVLPAHPHAVSLARLLLRAGADPNDGQALYNRMFGPNDDHLEVLFEFGLGRDTSGPWHRLLGDQIESPIQMLLNLLDWAVSHDQQARVALLAAHGVDVVSATTGSRRASKRPQTPLEVALLNGHRELADQLRGYGADEPHLEPVERFVAAVLAGDPDSVAATTDEVVAAARSARPGLIVWATGLGRRDAVDLLVELGFDVNAYGRGDIPSELPRVTALHVAAGNGDARLVARLLELGADPELRDRFHDGRALDWARFNEQPAVVELLAAVTREP